MAIKEAPLKVMVVVIPRNNEKEANDLLNELNVGVMWSIYGSRVNLKGSTIMGVGTEDCSVLICLVPTIDSKNILKGFIQKINAKNEKAVAFLTRIGALSQNTLTGCFSLLKCIKQRNEYIDFLVANKEPSKEGKQ